MKGDGKSPANALFEIRTLQTCFLICKLRKYIRSPVLKVGSLDQCHGHRLGLASRCTELETTTQQSVVWHTQKGRVPGLEDLEICNVQFHITSDGTCSSTTCEEALNHWEDRPGEEQEIGEKLPLKKQVYHSTEWAGGHWWTVSTVNWMSENYCVSKKVFFPLVCQHTHVPGCHSALPVIGCLN